MASLLEDLDELVLRCRDEKARRYIAEAVASYRAGAFRSAIVAAWIAVCFDVIEKFRELALAGDVEAEKQVQEIDVTRRTNDLSRALKFERELLGLARDKFELLSPLEHIDLARLQEDRNRCAHPSLAADDQAYAPSAELARVHIHSAVTHLLQHPPVQGKHALDRLLGDIDSEYFPTTVQEAKVAFASGPLRRPRDSLVRNLVIVLVKVLLNDKPEWKRIHRISAALQACRELHYAQFSKVMSEKLSSLFRAAGDEGLFAEVRLLRSVPNTWEFLEADVHQRLKTYVSVLPAKAMTEIDFLLGFAPLQEIARHRVAWATLAELSPLFFFDAPQEVIDRYIDIYLGSASFEDANECAKSMLHEAADFTAEHVRRLLTSVAKNRQIMGSFQLGPLLAKLRYHKKLAEAEFEQLLQANGLSTYATSTSGDGAAAH